MKSQEECFKALVDGRTLISSSKNLKLKFVNGHVCEVSSPIDSPFNKYRESFSQYPEDWEIYKEPEVYELELLWDYDGRVSYPHTADGSFNFRTLVDKKTKVRIEVIE